MCKERSRAVGEIRQNGARNCQNTNGNLLDWRRVLIGLVRALSRNGQRRRALADATYTWDSFSEEYDSKLQRQIGTLSTGVDTRTPVDDSDYQVPLPASSTHLPSF